MKWRALVVVTLLAAPAFAQSAPAGVSPGVTTALTRARALADAGDGARARDLLDSLVEAAPRESPDASEVLYWRALLSEEASLAERDWKRIVVEMPFSPRASDALLRLSELDLLRSNPKLARQHVQQLLVDHPASPQRAPALLILARAYFEERDAPRACGVLSMVRREAPISAVEVRLQADEMQQQCRNVREVAFGTLGDTVAPASTNPTLPVPTPGLPPALPVPLPRAPAPATGASARPATSTAAGRWTVQLAAYDTQGEADAFVRRLGAQGVDAHSTGSKKPYRVQTGQYATRAVAASALAAFKKQGLEGFVTEVPRP